MSGAKCFIILYIVWQKRLFPEIVNIAYFVGVNVLLGVLQNNKKIRKSEIQLEVGAWGHPCLTRQKMVSGNRPKIVLY